MGISVSGIGEVTGTPDTVEVDLGVSILADTVDEATSKAAERADALIAALASNDVAKDDITTTDYSIYPEYDYPNNKQRLTGYRVSNTVRARIRNIEETGAVLDSVTTAAGDEVRVSRLRFSIEDDAELTSAAREAAWNDALTKATQLAELSGQKLGAVTSILESVNKPPLPIPFERALAADQTMSPIEPGASPVTITLQVEFAFEA